MYFLCPQCKLAYPTFRGFHLHWVKNHADLPKPKAEEIEVEELPPEYELREPRPKKKRTPEPAYEEIEKLKREISKLKESPRTLPEEEESKGGPYKDAGNPNEILRNILLSYPKMSEDVVNEIMSWAEYETLTPMAVEHLLSNMTVPKGAASIIPQKYGLALQKAAASGDAKIQMLLAGWGGGVERPPQPGHHFSGFGSGYQLPWQRYPYHSGYGYLPPEPPEEKLREKKSEKEIEELKKHIGHLQSIIEKREEEIKEEKHREEIEKLKENHIREIEKIEEKYKGEIAEIKELIKGEKGSEIEELRAEIRDLNKKLEDEKYGALVKELSELKKRESSSPSELAVIQSAAKEGIQALRSAGSDLKAVFMAKSVKEHYPPGRRSPEERERLGEELTRALEEDREKIGQMDAFFGRYKEGE